jgi:hypothetical protein
VASLLLFCGFGLARLRGFKSGQQRQSEQCGYD